MTDYYENVIFPDGFPGVIDVTKAPYFADNTGRTDCTETLCRILDDVTGVYLKGMKEAIRVLDEAEDGTYLSIENRHVNGRSYPVFPIRFEQYPVIYFPCGTYLVSNTVTYRHPDLHNGMYYMTSGGMEANSCIRMIGQNMERTVIRLRDYSPAFAAGGVRPVVSFMNGERSNISMSNYFENLTIDTGVGNPGAEGLLFFANNSGAVRHVTVRSSDPGHIGYAGIEMRHDILSAGYLHDITVDGFSYGITVTPFRNMAAIEEVKLTNQLRYGIYVGNTIISIRKVYSENRIPTLFVGGYGAHVVFTDAEIRYNGEEPAGQAAVKYSYGTLLMRNVNTHGFKFAYDFRMWEKTLPDGYIDEYLEGEAKTLRDREARTLNLPVPDLPSVGWEQDMEKWISVKRFGAVGDGVTDDTDALERAFGSGLRYICFEPGHYLVTRPVVIPASVEHVNFMFCDIMAGEMLSQNAEEGVFLIEGDTDRLLFLERLFSWDDCLGKIRMFCQKNRRPLFMRDIHTQACATYHNTVPGGEVFLENTACTIGLKNLYQEVPAFDFYGKNVWAHHLNPERSRYETVNTEGSLWIFGFKTEGGGMVTKTVRGKTEILGGIQSIGLGNDDPTVLSEDSDVSASYATNGIHSYSAFPVAVREIADGEALEIRDSEMPKRADVFYFCPLYSGRCKK